MWILRALQKIEMIALENNCSDVVILGDLFHARKTLDVITYNAIYSMIKHLSLKFKIWLLVGNHDCALLDSEHALLTFTEIHNVEVIDTVRVETIAGKTVKFIPFLTDKEKIKEEIKSGVAQQLIFGHFTCTTAVPPKVMSPLKQGIDIEEELKGLDSHILEQIILGHFHNYQTNGKVTYIGAPIMHNAGDSEDRKYVGVYNTTSNKLELVDTTDSFPLFRYKTFDDTNIGDMQKYIKDTRPQDYLQITTKTSKKVVVPDGVNVIETPVASSQSRLDIKSESTLQDIMKAFSDLNENKNLENKKLLEVGLSILEATGVKTSE
jgi:DNA repair exonuclease SbcCD nuclease subunit